MYVQRLSGVIIVFSCFTPFVFLGEKNFQVVSTHNYTLIYRNRLSSLIEQGVLPDTFKELQEITKAKALLPAKFYAQNDLIVAVSFSVNFEPTFS